MLWGVSKAALVGVFSGAVVTAAIALTAPGADAKSTYESPYTYDQTWNASLRMVRVDNRWKITEKDDQNGYILFEYKSPENNKVSPGTLEFVRGRDTDAAVNVLVQLPEMPTYHEQMLLDQLAAKMRHEYGDPPAHKKRSPEGPPDAGPDAPPE
jgi:hypothetical protein